MQMLRNKTVVSLTSKQHVLWDCLMKLMYFVQSELYFHLLYGVTLTNQNIGLSALSIALLLVISSLLVTGGVLCCFLSAKDDQTKVNPNEEI